MREFSELTGPDRVAVITSYYWTGDRHEDILFCFDTETVQYFTHFPMNARVL